MVFCNFMWLCLFDPGGYFPDTTKYSAHFHPHHTFMPTSPSLSLHLPISFSHSLFPLFWISILHLYPPKALFYIFSAFLIPVAMVICAASLTQQFVISSFPPFSSFCFIARLCHSHIPFSLPHYPPQGLWGSPWQGPLENLSTQSRCFWPLNHILDIVDFLLNSILVHSIWSFLLSIVART